MVYLFIVFGINKHRVIFGMGLSIIQGRGMEKIQYNISVQNHNHNHHHHQQQRNDEKMYIELFMKGLDYYEYYYCYY